MGSLRKIRLPSMEDAELANVGPKAIGELRRTCVPN